MKVSNKQKSEIFNTMRHQLAIQHMDSLEYPHGLKVGECIEKNTQAVFEAIDDLPNYAIHNVIANLRGDFREMRRWVIDEYEDPVEAMRVLYNTMMGITKQYLYDDEYEEEEEEEEKCQP